ncbi:MAG: hypothetical protein QOJ76_424 [Acidobacteriota bacterium]|jgi:hypothetical protein|nr:hypothetical protein [Acidobacteriota bacterium]
MSYLIPFSKSVLELLGNVFPDESAIGGSGEVGAKFPAYTGHSSSFTASITDEVGGASSVKDEGGRMRD